MIMDEPRVGKFDARWQIASDIVWFATLRESGVSVGIIDDVLWYKRVPRGEPVLRHSMVHLSARTTQLLKQTIDRRRSSFKSNGAR